MPVSHGAWSRVLADKYDISGESNEFTITYDHPVADCTGFTLPAKRYVSGQYSWKADVRGWYDASGTASGQGVFDGTAGAETAISDLSSGASDTAPVSGTVPGTNKVWGFWPGGLGTAAKGYAGIGPITNVTRTAPIGAAVGMNFSVAGTSPLTRAQCLWAANVTVTGTSLCQNHGSVSTGGAYCYFWLIGTINTTLVGTIFHQDSMDPVGGGTAIAEFNGTVATAKAVLGTLSADGYIGSHVYATYGAGGGFGGTMVMAIGRL